MSLVLRELTPRGRGAVSVLELAGPGALARAAELTGGDLRVGDLRLARLQVGADVLDEALVVVLAEDRVELHLHGAPPILEELRRTLSAEVESEPPPATQHLQAVGANPGD